MATFYALHPGRNTGFRVPRVRAVVLYDFRIKVINGDRRRTMKFLCAQNVGIYRGLETHSFGGCSFKERNITELDRAVHFLREKHKSKAKCS